jgi:hypothetical protein
MTTLSWTQKAGDSKTLMLTARKPDGTVQSLVGATAIRWQLSRSVNARPPLVSKDLITGITIIDGAAGQISVDILPADTEEIVGMLYHELQVDLADGTRATPLHGNVTLEAHLIRNAA